MLAIDFRPKIGNSDVIRKELLQALNDMDFFVSGNAAEALIELGVKEISGVPTREYASNLRRKNLGEEMNKFLKGI